MTSGVRGGPGVRGGLVEDFLADDEQNPVCFLFFLSCSGVCRSHLLSCAMAVDIAGGGR